MAKRVKSPTQAAAIQAYLFEVASKNQIIKPQGKKMVAEALKKFPNGIGLNGDDKDWAIYIENINKLPPLVFMDDKKVVEIMLKNYSSVLTHILGYSRGEFERLINYLKLQGMHEGLCYYSRVKLGVSLVDKEWLQAHIKGNHLYLCNRPIVCDRIEDVIRAISNRVNILQEILNELNTPTEL